MRVAFCVLQNLLGFLIIFGYPFFAVFRGQKILRTILIAWGAIFLWSVFFSFGLPMFVNCFSTEFADELWDWVPDPRGIVGTVFIGWLMPSVAASIAVAARGLLRKDHV